MAQMESKTEIVTSTEQFDVVKSYEPDGETIYNLYLGKVTVNFFTEEWDEFLEFADEVVKIPLGITGTIAETESYLAACEEMDGDIIYSIEMPGATLFFFEEDWKEIIDLFNGLK